jgi:hypothetical protein
MRSALLVTGGVVLIAAGVVDGFAAVLHYDRHGPLTSRLYRAVWAAVRGASRLVRGRARDQVRSFGVPLLILANLVLWTGLEAVGFALLYYDGFARGAFTFGPGLEPTAANALYFSGLTLSTVGFGDLTPTTPLYQGLAVAESFIGFSILTLTISYVVSVYQVFQGINVITASLQHQSDENHGDHAIAIIEPHFPDGEPVELSTRLQWLHVQLLSYHEALHRYPLVYYFCSDRRYVNQRFGTPADSGVPRHVDPSAFAAMLDAGAPYQDDGVGRFLRIDAAMRRVVRSSRPDPDHLYERYAGWLEFARPASAFVRGAAEYLAYDLALLDPEHDRQLL